MSYSQQNPAWDRMLKGRHDARIQREAECARRLQQDDRMLSRSEALRRAVRVVDREESFDTES